MGDYFEDILATYNGDKVAAATEVGRGLMAGDPNRFQVGYTAPNAALAVRDLYGLTFEETDQVYLVLDPGASVADREVFHRLAGDARSRFGGPSREHDDSPGDDPAERDERIGSDPTGSGY